MLAAVKLSRRISQRVSARAYPTMVDQVVRVLWKRIRESALRRSTFGVVRASISASETPRPRPTARQNGRRPRMLTRSVIGRGEDGVAVCGSVRAVCGRRGGHSVRRGRKARGGQTPALSGCCVDVVSRPRGLPRDRRRERRAWRARARRRPPTRSNGHSERIDSERIADFFFPKVPWS